MRSHHPLQSEETSWVVCIHTVNTVIFRSNHWSSKHNQVLTGCIYFGFGRFLFVFFNSNTESTVLGQIQKKKHRESAQVSKDWKTSTSRGETSPKAQSYCWTNETYVSGNAAPIWVKGIHAHCQCTLYSIALPSKWVTFVVKLSKNEERLHAFSKVDVRFAHRTGITASFPKLHLRRVQRPTPSVRRNRLQRAAPCLSGDRALLRVNGFLWMQVETSVGSGFCAEEPDLAAKVCEDHLGSFGRVVVARLNDELGNCWHNDGRRLILWAESLRRGDNKEGVRPKTGWTESRGCQRTPSPENWEFSRPLETLHACSVQFFYSLQFFSAATCVERRPCLNQRE